MASDKQFSLPKLKDSVSFRPNELDKRNLRILMAEWRVTRVSDVLRECLTRQAEPVRQRWQEAAERRAKESDG